MKRVVVTGLGVVSPIGVGRDDFWSALVAGRNGVAKITSFDASDLPVTIAAEVKEFNALEYLDRKEVRRTDRYTQYAVAAAQLAVRDAGLDLNALDKQRFGVFVGSGIGGMQTFEEQHRALLDKGRVSPLFVPKMIANIAAGHISIMVGAKGPCSSPVTACATGASSIGEAFRALQYGEADVILAGGSEAAITPLSIAGFAAAGALSYKNDDPGHASRPFDAERDGFVMGEGAGILVLETLEHALERGANIYAELLGFGRTSDAYHVTAPAPQGEGAARCMAAALQDARLKPEQIVYVNAHGTSTPLNDKNETLAIKSVFGEHASKLAISSIKSMTGHMLGAAGAVEFVATVLSVHNGVIPPTINYQVPDPECDLDYVPNKARRQEVPYAISNSFGFGGQNACLVVGEFRTS